MGRILANMQREIYNDKRTLCRHKQYDEVHIFFECPNILNIDLDDLIVNRIGIEGY